jgi:uncharacterized damage-inducible protein DinB
MKDVEMYAKYSQEGNKAVYDILSKLGNDEREKDRGSYFGSLSGIFRHIIGATYFFLGMFKAPLSGNAAALKALSALDGFSKTPEGILSEAQWKELGEKIDALDSVYTAVAAAISDADLKNQLKIDWYEGNPAEVPLSFMLSQLVVHNTHHRGQISQILDSLKIDNDYSGINVNFIQA